MKKLPLILLVLVVAVSGCQKDPPEPEDRAEVSFVLSQSHQLKDDPVIPDFEYKCWNNFVDYAFVVVNGETYYLDVFYLQGIPYTQSIELSVSDKPYIIEEFILIYETGTPDDLSDDHIIMAAPHSSSIWGEYVTKPVDISFDVTGVEQFEIEVEMLCYEEVFHDHFGFIYY